MKRNDFFLFLFLLLLYTCYYHMGVTEIKISQLLTSHSKNINLLIKLFVFTSSVTTTHTITVFFTEHENPLKSYHFSILY